MSTIIVFISIVITMAFAAPLLELVLLMGGGYVLRKITWIDRWAFVRDFLLVRAERKIFYAYLATMAPVVGFPWICDVAIQYITKESSIYAFVQFTNDNTICVSVAYLAIVTIGYAIYAYIIINRNRDSYSKEIRKGLSIINRELDFVPNQEWFNTALGIHRCR